MEDLFVSPQNWGRSQQPGLPGLEGVCVLEQRHIHVFLPNHQLIQLSLSA